MPATPIIQAPSARTLAMIVGQARTLLQDTVATAAGQYRYNDQDLIDNINGAMAEARRLRADLFLAIGMRNALPVYEVGDIAANTPFPLDEQYFMAFVYYTVGRAEMREDTFADNSRAITLVNKFVNQMLGIMS